jgi:hypothetical protein
LILNPNWQGATQDVIDIENSNNKEKQQREKPRKLKNGAHRSLGVHEAPAGLRGAQFEALV